MEAEDLSIMFTVLVANPKGGAGKTTIATTLAAYLAGKRQRVVILDRDRQRSAARWLARRPRGFPEVRGALPDTDAKVIRACGNPRGRACRNGQGGRCGAGAGRDLQL